MLSYHLSCYFFFFFNDTATTEIYTLSLHDALPICRSCRGAGRARPPRARSRRGGRPRPRGCRPPRPTGARHPRSEEQTAEIQSPCYLIYRLSLLKKKKSSPDNCATGSQYHTYESG